MTVETFGENPPVLADVDRRAGARSPIVGRYNRSLVLEAIRLHPRASRVEIARITGLTSAAVSNIVRGLIETELVIETGTAASRGGKPGVQLQIRSRHRYAVGLHLRPNSFGAVLADLDGTIIHHESTNTKKSGDPTQVLHQAASLVRRMLRKEHVADESIVGVGVATPGPVDHQHRHILDAPNLPGWHGTPVAAVLAARLGQRATLVNNANAAAVGEKWLGSAQGIGTFLYVYLGIGVGGAIFIDHRLYDGVTSNAGAIGHMSVDPDGPLCGCGNRGCLEATVSAAAMVSRVAARQDLAGRIGLTLGPENVDSDHRKLLRLAARGDAEVMATLAPAFEQLGIGIASLINVLDVDHVILGGPAVSREPELYLEPVLTAVTGRPIARQVQNIQVTHSSLGDRAAVIGAAATIFQEAYGPNLATSSPKEIHR